MEPFNPIALFDRHAESALEVISNFKIEYKQTGLLQTRHKK